MAFFKSIIVSSERIYWEPARKSLTVSGAVKCHNEKFSVSVHARTEDCKTERNKALIVVRLPDGSYWEGEIDKLTKALQEDKINMKNILVESK